MGAILPLCHIGGFRSSWQRAEQQPVRAIPPLRRVKPLSDAAKKGATHVSVVDKMLQDMVAADKPETLARYSASCWAAARSARRRSIARPCGRACTQAA
ncbi:MAG: hypothetical protein ACLT98_14690 [Eggerthellaceae bacterium]